MKKSLIALSVLAAVAGTAQAQSSVTIYGIVDMALQHQNTGDPAGSTLGLDSGIQSGSRLGFKGSEDLGGGLKANFQLEMGIATKTINPTPPPSNALSSEKPLLTDVLLRFFMARLLSNN